VILDAEGFFFQEKRKTMKKDIAISNNSKMQKKKIINKQVNATYEAVPVFH
jgi:hypothetical protein